MVNVESQEAYLLHTRPYTDSRVLVDFFSSQYGRISGVMRRPSGKNKNIAVQPFTPLYVSWRGKNALKTITLVENASRSLPLASKPLYCGFYLNEILQRCLKEDDPHELLYAHYDEALKSLACVDKSDSRAIEVLLRTFELQLLECLGFAIDFGFDTNENPITSDALTMFRYIEQHGFIPIVKEQAESYNDYPGDVLASIKQRDFSNARTLKYVKRLCRQALLPIIGDRPLKARELFV